MLVLFDLDGTLTDSGLAIKSSFEYTCDELAIARPTPEELRAFIGPPLEVTFGNILPDLADVARAVEIYRERYTREAIVETFLYDGIVEALDALAANGHRFAIATSKDQIAARLVLEHFDLVDRFAVLAGALRDGSRHHKADVIAFALEALAWDGQPAVMVGDRDHDVLGARVHGIDTIGVLWGFGSAAELAAAEARWTVEHPSELAPIIG